MSGLREEFLAALRRDGNEYQRGSNVVGVGADEGKVLDASSRHKNLVTEGVASCIAVVAVSRDARRTGLWHLYHGEAFGTGIEDHLLPALAAQFPPAETDLYLIGGKKGLSEALAQRLGTALPGAGYGIANTALFGPDRLDIAVTRGGAIFVAAENTNNLLFSKPAERRAPAPR